MWLGFKRISKEDQSIFISFDNFGSDLKISFQVTALCALDW